MFDDIIGPVKKEILRGRTKIAKVKEPETWIPDTDEEDCKQSCNSGDCGCAGPCGTTGPIDPPFCKITEPVDIIVWSVIYG